MSAIFHEIFMKLSVAPAGVCFVILSSLRIKWQGDKLRKHSREAPYGESGISGHRIYEGI